MVNVAYVYQRDREVIGEKDFVTFYIIQLRKDGKLDDLSKAPVSVEFKPIQILAVSHYKEGYGLDFNRPAEVPEIYPGKSPDTMWSNHGLGPLKIRDIRQEIREYRTKSLEEEVIN